MASSLLCPVCHKTQDALPVHLRRTCMKNQPETEITQVVEKAKQDVMELLKEGRIFHYADLRDIISSGNPLQRLVADLECRHMVVLGAPSLPEPSAENDPVLSDSEVELAPSDSEVEPVPSDVNEPDSTTPGTSAKVISTEVIITGVTSTEVTSTEVVQPGIFHSDASDNRDGEMSDEGGEMPDEAPVEPCSNVPNARFASPARQLMHDNGLYAKHSLEHPLLKDFANYLRKDLAIGNFKQEVENVARYLYFADSETPSLRFVFDKENLRRYLCTLTEAGLKKRTQQNYLKSLKRFLIFHTLQTNLRKDDEKLHKQCLNFIKTLSSLQQILSRHSNREITQKRYDMLMDPEPLTPQAVTAVMDIAKKDFLEVLEKLSEEGPAALLIREKTLVLFYLEAVFMLHHLQRPSVVENMTVSEWEERKSGTDCCVVGIKEHKNAAQTVASFGLTKEEEKWFDLYYSLLRPNLLRAGRKRKRNEDEENPKGLFFISTTGKQIYNASNDLHSLHARYKQTQVTSQMARRAFETGTIGKSDTEKMMVASYLSHSNGTAEKHYRIRTDSHAARGAAIVNQIHEMSSPISSSSGASHGRSCVGASSESSGEKSTGSSPDLEEAKHGHWGKRRVKM